MSTMDKMVGDAHDAVRHAVDVGRIRFGNDRDAHAFTVGRPRVGQASKN